MAFFLNPENFIRNLLLKADVQIDGSRPWDIQVKNPDLYARILRSGTLGAGESYMDGWWECEKLDEFFYHVGRADLEKMLPNTFIRMSQYWQAFVLNLQSRSGSKKVVREHYDLGNELYESFLDPYNQYTCGYFKDTEDLNTAQEQKLDLQCRKLELKSSDHVLDIGCGWGGFAKYAASHYGCRVTGITISDNQISYARTFCEGLPVEIRKCDYRDLRGSFDKVLICGMIEHVGVKNYRSIMETVARCLKPGGLFLLHTIGTNKSAITGEPWIMKYIFPNSMLPSIRQIAAAAEGLFVMEDWQNFGFHYYKTLLAWHRNFLAAWPKLADKYGERFKRMWEYYLLSCAGMFKARKMQLWQIMFSKEGVAGGYVAAR